ncbi:MAG: hypothetical protein EA369_01480 [Bradymonadales bacterium]|nr:MAG: hypothetical protein EA369_01480 [Bradymonadales bacterium]
MSQMRSNIDNAEDWFEIRTQLIVDPYFEREFFTNLIYIMDRKKTIRELFECSLKLLDRAGQYNDQVDRSLLHLMHCFQATNSLREGYQWLPMAQGLYSLALSRGEARAFIDCGPELRSSSKACSVQDFEVLIRREAREINSFEEAWSSLLFLLENRSVRAQAIQVLVTQSSQESDDLTFQLLMKALDLAFSFAWKKNDLILRRAFTRFWTRPQTASLPVSVARAASVLSSGGLEAPQSSRTEWRLEWAEELWHRISKESLESAWEMMRDLSRESCGLDQLVLAIELFRGRLLFGMRQEQWPLVTRSLLRADAWGSAARWIPEKREFYLAACLSDLVSIAQRVNYQALTRPTGDSIYGSFSENMTKNQLVLRLDDSVEQGDREQALELMALLTRDRGMSQSLSDRLLLLASKQDAWTYDQASIPTAKLITQTYRAAVQAGLPQATYSDAAFGLLRFLCDQRELALLEAKTRGQYQDGGLTRSVFDVSGGARIVDRFVFNQLRNAQRIFVWPTEGKG